jgi:hypothetical protein
LRDAYVEMSSQPASLQTLAVLVTMVLMLLTGLGKRRLERRPQPRRLAELLRLRARQRSSGKGGPQ